MLLSGLIFLPILAVPTVLFLKKPFQIKIFYSLVMLIKFIFSLGVLTKYGYLFNGVALSEKHLLYSDLGFNYSVSLDGTGLLLMTAVNFLYLILGALSLEGNVKMRATALFISNILAMLILSSSNLLLVSLAVFLFTLISMLVNGRDRLRSSSASNTLLYGFSSLLGVSLVLGILYESVYGQVNLDVLALSEMRTPFVKGSFYSTQFVLFLFYSLGFCLIAFSNFKDWLGQSRNKLNFKTLLPFVAIALNFYVGLKFLPVLFPEAAALYLPAPGLIKAGSLAGAFLVLFFVLVKKSMTLFLERKEHV